MLVNEGVVNLLVLTESGPGFSVFGVRAWTEMKIWCVYTIIQLTCLAAAQFIKSGIFPTSHLKYHWCLMAHKIQIHFVSNRYVHIHVCESVM